MNKTTPYGFDAEEYAAWSRYETGDLEAIAEDCEEGIETLTEMRNMITHILQARMMTRFYPNAAGCRDCTEEARRL